MRTGIQTMGPTARRSPGAAAAEAGMLQAVALLRPGIGRVQQRYAARCPQLLDLVQVLTHIRGFLG
jgi:hypothetical protein